MSIIDNIRDDAAAYVRNGIPMPHRGPQWDTFVKEAIEEEKRKVDQEAFIALEGLERKLATSNGLSYDEWLAKAKKLYSIDPNTSVVTSISRGPDNGRTWEEDSQLAARRRVYTLMRYKKYDHFERGRDFAYDPDNKE